MKNDKIIIKNGWENNLKGIDLEINKNSITIFTGVSGSGKSSIVFDTIAQEAGRQLNETYSSYTRLFLPKYTHPKVDDILNISPVIVVDQKKLGANARSTLGTVTEINNLFRVLFSRYSNSELKYANNFSFNDPSGMCLHCEGIGKVITLNMKKALDVNKSLNEGAILLSGYKPGSHMHGIYANSGFFDNDKKIKDYSEEEYYLLVNCEPRKIKSEYQGKEFNLTYEGIKTRFVRTNLQTAKDTNEKAREKLAELTTTELCEHCHGKRYNDKVLDAKINGYNIFDLTDMELDQLLSVIQEFKVEEAKVIVDKIIQKTKALCDIGLGYLNLTRETASLSGGESQRVKMVKYLSSSLTDLIYIFDEPSTGLHPRDVYRLNNLLKEIRDKGNTVLVVEHDPDVIQIADYIVDVGPKAGSNGGQIMFTGTYEDFLKTDTLTATHLNKHLEINEKPRTCKNFIESSKSSLHNLKDVSLKIPENLFTVVCGVAGSGKSSLVTKVFAEEYDTILIDQNPIHTNRRSNPATYMKFQDHIRKLFAKENDVEAGMFSSNSIGGCKTCNGNGTIELNMSFMENVEVECPDCHGTRFIDEVLNYEYNNKNIIEVMDMSIKEASEFFKDKKILKILDNLIMVGLDYISLGQPLNTLSGGECQRLKIASELNQKGNIYILDEPTTGLHMSDVNNIIDIINSLIDKGNTLIVIEHNTDVIKNADWIIDMGPDGGKNGGNITFEGYAKDIINSDKSITAKYL